MRPGRVRVSGPLVAAAFWLARTVQAEAAALATGVTRRSLEGREVLGLTLFPNRSG